MDILKELSSQTGGSAFHIDKHTTLDAALRAIEEQLRNQYAIGYAPPENSMKKTFHKVEVRVNKPGFTVRVRSGYFRWGSGSLSAASAIETQFDKIPLYDRYALESSGTDHSAHSHQFSVGTFSA
jgi:hypothetical protein